MSQSLAKVLVHGIFSTKNRQGILDPSIQGPLKAYMIGILKNLDSPSLELETASDHVHVLFQLSKTVSLSNAIKDIKIGSSKWIKTQEDRYRDFHWQNGYGAFSVSESNVANVREYIRGQTEHHKTISFQEEFRAFLQRHGVEYDERYVWD